MSIYSDFDINFDLTETGDIKKLTDEECVKKSIRNIFFLNEFDIPFNTWFYTNIKNFLFDNPDKVVINNMKNVIKNALEKDPRFEIEDIQINTDYTLQNYVIEIVVFCYMLNSDISTIIDIPRVR